MTFEITHITSDVSAELSPGLYCLADPMIVLKTIVFQRIWPEDYDITPGVYQYYHDKIVVNYTGILEGECKDSLNHVFPILSGSLAFIPYHLCNEVIHNKHISSCGMIKHFEDPVMFYSNGEGRFEILSTNYSYILDTDENHPEEDYDY